MCVVLWRRVLRAVQFFNLRFYRGKTSDLSYMQRRVNSANISFQIDDRIAAINLSAPVIHEKQRGV